MWCDQSRLYEIDVRHSRSYADKISRTQDFPRQKKRRKKQHSRESGQASQTLRSISLSGQIISSSPPCLHALVLLLVAPLLLANIVVFHRQYGALLVADAQIVLDHPRHQGSLDAGPTLNHLHHMRLSPPYSTPIHFKQDERLTSSRKSKPASGVSTEATRDKQSELVRKLASRRFLEVLSKYPSTINGKNLIEEQRLRSKLAESLSKRNTNTNTNSIISSKPENNIREQLKPDNPGNEDKQTSSTSLQQSIDKSQIKPDEEKVPTNVKSDLFNASSLNYLVEKLLNVDSLKQSTKSPSWPSRRPLPRQSLAQRTNLKNHSAVSSDEVNLFSDTPKTLDILIRDEYNSRVEPMLQSLLTQQRLSGQQTHQSSPSDNLVTRAGPVNHKTTEPYSTMSSTSLDPVATSPYKISPSSQEAPSATDTPDDADSHNTMVDFEDLLDLDGDGESDETDEEEETQEKAPSPSVTQRSKTLLDISNPGPKVLRNVPPYQLSVNSNTVDPKLSPKIHQPETQTTTSSTLSAVTSQSSLDNQRRSTKGGERDAVASNGGSLLFSDGAEEAMRLNHSGTENKSQNSTDPRANSRVKLNNLGPNSGETTSLRQLFSTLRPLRESQVKQNEHTTAIQREHLGHNPFIYSGYVGKDDYLISSIASDWSKPISNRDPNAAVLYRRPNNSVITSTRRPSYDPPTTYSTYLEQPVTNAQTMPQMIRPANRPHGSKITKPTYLPDHQIDHRMNNSSHLHIPTVQGPPSATLGHEHHGTTHTIPTNDTAKRGIQHSEASLNERGNTIGTFDNRVTPTIQTYRPNDASLSDKYDPKTVKFLENSQNGSNHIGGQSSVHMYPEQLNPITLPPLMSIVGTKVDSNTHKTFARPPERNRTAPTDAGTQAVLNSSFRKGLHPIGIESLSQPEQNSLFPVSSDGNSSSQVSTVAHGAMKNTLVGSNSSQLEDISDDSNRSNQDRTTSKSSSKFKHLAERPQIHRERPESMQDYQASESDQHELSSGQQQVPVKQLVPRNYSDNVSLKNLQRPMNSYESARGGTLLDGIDKQDHNNHRRNSTNGSPKTSLDSNEENLLTHVVSNHSSSSINPTSSLPGSTIIPSSNFFSEASSESPMFDNSITMAGGDRLNKHNQGSTDLYQRIGSTSSIPVVSSSNTVETREVNNAKQNEPPPTLSTKTSGKSSDRMAFILIGGSCALSVVCLVFAAMSMRCQDMCDDYRSLRNAERAALKLQKHRLRYTKSHQVNRVNALTSSGEAQLDEFNTVNGLKQDNLTDKILESDITNNQRCLNAHGNGSNKLLEHVSSNICSNGNNGLSNERSPGFTSWIAPSCQLPVSALVHRDGPCGCSNCSNYRWIAQNEMLANNKHLSLLHPYYFMQNQSRLKPPFGAGSSVGTFFPRRLDDQSFHVGGSSDAQILVDNQRAHSCHAGSDQRGLFQSKSILQRSKRYQPRHSGRTEHLNCADTSGIECNNPNHLHHAHKYDPEPSASEESEIIVDESILCDSDKCSPHHYGRYHCHHSAAQSCVKVPHVKLHQSNHNRRSMQAKSSQPHHHHHHHHHHAQHQPSSSSETGSIAQCTCNRDQQPLITGNHSRQHSTRHKVVNYKQSKHESRASVKRNGRRDKSLLVWSTNRDQLI